MIFISFQIWMIKLRGTLSAFGRRSGDVDRMRGKNTAK